MNKTGQFFYTLTGKVNAYVMPEGIYLGKFKNLPEAMRAVEDFTGNKLIIKSAKRINRLGD